MVKNFRYVLLYNSMVIVMTVMMLMTVVMVMMTPTTRTVGWAV